MLCLLFAIAIIAIYFYRKSPTAKGHKSEQTIARKLSINRMWRYGGKTLTNIYIPKPSGDTAEIDVLYITKKGLLVLENKNYAGYIFGNESNANWMVTLYAGKGKKVEKHPFYNPIWQNRTHIKWLREYLNSDIKTFSLITFSNRGDLKSITVNSPNVFVCNHAKLSRVLRKIRKRNPDVLTQTQIRELYNELLPLTKVNRSTKRKHIADIHNRFSNADICPVCGGRLVLRTTRKGLISKSRFYGCSNYPKCRYTRNL